MKYFEAHKLMPLGKPLKFPNYQIISIKMSPKIYTAIKLNKANLSGSRQILAAFRQIWIFAYRIIHCH
jgi:hypothetical protein